MSNWITAVPAYLTSASILLIPGGLVVLAGWGAKSPKRWLLAPAISVAIAALAATIGSFAGLRWSLLPLALTTIAVAAVALVVRRFAGTEPSPGPRWTHVVVYVTFAVTLLVTAIVFARAFGAPDNIAQRFDNIVHLNAIALAVQTGDASPFQIGATSDIAAYPNAWHALTTLALELTGTSVPVAVNAANLAVVSILWPASVMALSGVLFAQRRSAFVVAAALSMGFGAFPALFFNWGVLYPNVVGYAMVPAALAAVVSSFAVHGPADAWRSALLIATLAGGTFLGHPNALLSALAFSAVYVLARLTVSVVETPSRQRWTALTIALLAFGVAIAAAWAAFRTSEGHSQWEPWQQVAQAVGEALLVSPRGYSPTITIVVLLAAAAVAVARSSRLIPTVAPFGVAILLFVVASGLSTENWFREWLTNPWYNDANRLAALLPIAAIPVATLGALAILDAVRTLADRHRLPVWLRGAGLALSVIAVFSVVIGPNVRLSLAQVHEAYAYTDDSLILSIDERDVLGRLDQNTPEDALIIGSPRTGTSLALALADREVTQRHVFGSPSPELTFLNAHLREIGTDPAVCTAVDELGIDYVLDFGRHDVINDADAAPYDGVQNLEPGPNLVLVDSEGPDARLFRIEGC